jgi:chromosome segregation ATPase
MSDPSDLTIHVLRQIRDEIVTTRTELGTRIDGVPTELGARIDSLGEHLGGRIDETNERVERVEHTLLDLAEQQRFIVRHLKTLSERDRRLEDDITEIPGRLDVVEKKLG